jgi:cytochrome c biogenesis protein CcmG/thiol:disulfide interchange protein DsbE
MTVEFKFARFIPLVLFAGLLFFLWRGIGHDPRQLPSALLNKAVPEFSLPRALHPEKQFTQADLKGQVSVLNVFATWCAMCRVEHATLLEMAKNTHVALFGLDYKDTQPAVRDWLQKGGNPYRKVGFDQKGLVAINLGVYGTPETFLIDAAGVIRYKHTGPITEHVYQTVLLPRILKLQEHFDA